MSTQDNAPVSEDRALGLFQAVGIELEYMIVDAETLAVRPMADRLLAEVGGSAEMEVELGEVAWSNELALHVIEMKTNGPRASLAGAGRIFQDSVNHMERLLAPMGARLLPTGMHPFMDPHVELVLWPHEDDVIYNTLHRIFDCRGHGWANLQSMHINLPFNGDQEFARLHAAMRLVLPILPALAASSPMCDGRLTGIMDTRMHVYRDNARRVPSVSGVVIPERVYSRAAYEGELLRRIYDDLAPLDPDGVLRHEWVNARGCIARFDRDAIEIRVLDLQECPAVDIAIAGATIALLRHLVEDRSDDLARQQALSEGRLADIMVPVIDDGGRALIRDEEYLELLGFPGAQTCRADDLWRHVVETVVARDPEYPAWREPLSVILARGCLARRIADTLGRAPALEHIQSVYRELAECLHEGRSFTGAARP